MSANPFEALLQEFLLEAHERLQRIEDRLVRLRTAAPAARPTLLADAARELHTLKGNSGMMGLAELQGIAHGAEEELKSAGPDAIDVSAVLGSLDRFRVALHAAGGGTAAPTASRGAAPGRAAEDVDLALGSVRVPFGALDELIDLVSEVVLFRNRLATAISAGPRLDPNAADYAEASRAAWMEIRHAYGGLGRTLDVIQDRVLRLRMVPLGSLFGSLNRLVFDESARVGKDVRLETRGGDTPLDKALLELAGEALGHLVRNAVVHGLEAPARRAQAGKSRIGTVRVLASAGAEAVQIEVADDGAGIDQAALRRIAEARGIETAKFPNILSVLFLPGFSTQREADMSAGRGVGLSAVQEAVRRRGGRIEILTEPGRGTTFLLHLPLSVSIARALLVRADGEDYALPLASVVDSRRLRCGESHRVNNAGVMRWRERTIPLLDLGCSFGTARAMRESGYVIVIEAQGKQRGLLADQIRGIQEVVVKGLDPIVGDAPGIAGSTVLGDGRAILILDPRSLVEAAPFVEAEVGV